MATEQLGPITYLIAGQPEFVGAPYTDYEILECTDGFEEDTEDKYAASGKFGANITYGRRETRSLTIEVKHAVTAADPESDFAEGGEIASGVLLKADGTTATAWNIVSATPTLTAGVKGVQVELIEQGDSLA